MIVIHWIQIKTSILEFINHTQEKSIKKKSLHYVAQKINQFTRKFMIDLIVLVGFVQWLADKVLVNEITKRIVKKYNLLQLLRFWSVSGVLNL